MKIRTIIDRLLPSTLWTRRFVFWWVAMFASLLLFDLLWMAQTTFRPFTFLPFYPWLLLCATVMAAPAVMSRRNWPLIVLLLVANAVEICNLMYCRTYLNAIPAQSYLLVGNLADFTDSVAEQFSWYYPVLPLLTIGIAYMARRFNDGAIRPSWRPYLATFAALAVLSLLADCWRGGPLRHIEDLRNNCYKATCVAPIYSITGFVVSDALQANEEITDADLQMVEHWLADQHKLVAAEADTTGVRRKNLVFILLESFESWPIELSVDGQEVTPVLNSLLADSTTFYAPNVVTQVGSGRSIDGQLLLLAGMYPMSNTVYAYQAAQNKYFTLPGAMKAHGGRTYQLSPDKPTTWNQMLVSRAFGVDSLLYHTSWDNVETIGVARRLSDKQLMLQTIEKMRGGEIWPQGENAMVIIVTYSGHAPFKIPERLRTICPPDFLPEPVRNYITAVNYTDASLAPMIEYLRSRPDWNETMVVITGDHEGLADLRKIAVRDAHSAEFVDHAQHTPFVVLNSPVAGRYEKPLGQVDVYSTILDLMGWGDYQWQGMGQSVLDPSFPGVAVGSVGNIEGDTTGIAPDRLDHLLSARRVSDRILRFNLFK